MLHQRCWVHKMRNILEHVRKRDHEQVKTDAQAIYRAEGRKQARAAFRVLRSHWRATYPAMVKRLERDLPELLSFFSFPRSLWRKLRTTNVIERCFVEVRRRTRPMVCFVNVASVDRIIYAIFNGMNENHQWKNRTLHLFTQALDSGQVHSWQRTEIAINFFTFKFAHEGTATGTMHRRPANTHEEQLSTTRQSF